MVYWGYQDNFKPVYFLWRKDFACTKTRHTLEVYTRVKNCCLCCLVLPYFCFVSWFLLVTCFCARKIFSCKKKKNRLEIVLTTSVYYTIQLKFCFNFNVIWSLFSPHFKLLNTKNCTYMIYFSNILIL